MRQSEEEFLYLPAPFFLVRAPTFAMEEFFRVLDANNLKETLFTLFQTSTVFRQALLIASKELYKAMLTIDNKTGRQLDQLTSSLLRYFLRMTSRCTPFGLFSFVSLGKWGEATGGYFKQTQLIKKARPDMEWLVKAIDKIVENPDYFPLLPITVNPLLTYTSRRIHLSYVRKKEKEGDKQSISIRLNALVGAIIKFAEASITVNELEMKLFTEFPSIDKDKTRGVIKQLVDQQILISSLHPSLLTDSPFDDFLNKIYHLNLNLDEWPVLLQINEEIQKYNQSLLDQGEEILLNLHQLMEKIAKVKSPLQVDLGCTTKQFSLPLCLKKDISEVLEVVWKLSSASTDEANYLKEYHSRFLEKYGTSRRIPLLELLDEDGLGIPDHYLDVLSKETNQTPRDNKWRKWLQNQWNLCLYERKKEIVLTDEIVDRFFNKTAKKSDAPLSFDLAAKVIADSPEKLNSGDYRIHLTSYLPFAGNFFGRFLYLLGTDTKELIKGLHRIEGELIEHSQLVELSYFPLAPRSANVAIHPNLRASQLDLADKTKNTLKINDIYVGANEEGFFFADKEGKEQWLFRSGNMLTSEISPIPIRFLRDVSRLQNGIFQYFFWNILKIHTPAVFLPRISYKKAILSAAQWTVDLETLEEEDKDKSVPLLIEKKLKKWMDRWEMPRYLYLTEGDNQILLDRRCEAHIKEIVQKIKNQGVITLVEKIDQDSHSNWLMSPLGTHSNEIIVPCTRNPKFSLPKPLTSISKVINIPPEQRYKSTGSDWLYLKIYLSRDSQERFILNTLSELTNQLLEQNICKQWFFIRYHDKEGGDHLRVRFQAEKEKILTTLIPIIHDWMMALFAERFIRNLHLGTYEREIERYGGEILIEAVEDFFCADTQTSLELMKILNQKENKLPNHLVAAISLLDFAKQFAPAFENPFEDVIYHAQDKSPLKGIREWRNTLINSFEQIFMGEDSFKNTDDFLVFQHAFQKREKQLLTIVELIKELRANHGLTAPVTSIYNSLIHMHCNRLMGLDSNLEKKARAYVSYALSESRKKESA